MPAGHASYFTHPQTKLLFIGVAGNPDFSAPALQRHIPGRMICALVGATSLSQAEGARGTCSHTYIRYAHSALRDDCGDPNPHSRSSTPRMINVNNPVKLRANSEPAPPEKSGVVTASIKLEKLVEDNIDFVWRSLRRFGVPNAEVDDATQQVFLVANEKMPQIRPGRERAFLLGVATRVASHARRAHERRENAKQRYSEAPPEAAPDPEHLTQQLQARDLLDKVLDTMPNEVRSVFVLFELEELSVDEVAELLALPRGTVATRLRRARVLFKQEAQRLKESREA